MSEPVNTFVRLFFLKHKCGAPLHQNQTSDTMSCYRRRPKKRNQITWHAVGDPLNDKNKRNDDLPNIRVWMIAAVHSVRNSNSDVTHRS